MEVPFALSRATQVPLHTQLENRLRESVRSGQIPPGAHLPSTRALARELGVARGVVVEAYAQLRAEGYLHTADRAKTFVADAAATGSPVAPPTSGGSPAALAYDFHPGVPDLHGFPRAAWTRCLRRAVGDLPARALSYDDLPGAPALLDALATHLGRSRAALAQRDRLLVTQGVTQGLALTCAALRCDGARRVAVEDPCWTVHRAIVEDAGMEVVPIPVDGDGMCVEALEQHAVDAVIVTPAHQFPLGSVLAPDRRSRLIEWARRDNAIVIEDDYDAEYRYDRDPVGALQGLAPDRVVYAGSASKTLAPALRLGWLLLPETLYASTLERKAFAGGATPLLDQLALAGLIDSGELHRHLRRMRRQYRRRRAAMIEALERELPDARLEGVAAGLHVVAVLPRGYDDLQLTAAAAGVGVGAHPLSWHYADPAIGRPGLILGYANQTEAAIERGVTTLATLATTSGVG